MLMKFYRLALQDAQLAERVVVDFLFDLDVVEVSEDRGDVHCVVLRRQMQQCVPVHVDIVQAALSFEIEVDKGMFVIRHDAVHQGGHQAVVSRVYRFFLLQLVSQVDCHFEVARNGRNVQRGLAAVVSNAGIGSKLLDEGAHRLDFPVESRTVK